MGAVHRPQGKQPSHELVADLDQSLGTGGTLILAWEEGGDDMLRRDVLRDLGVLTLVGPLAKVESIRQDLAEAIGTRSAAERWDELVAEYACTFYLSDPQTLLRDLLADAQLIGKQLSGLDGRARQPLCRAAGQLAAITAMTWAGLGQHRQARRWWGTARDAADASGDTATRVWVRGWEVANGLYERRPVRLIFDRAAEAIAIAGDRADAGTAGLLAGLAQTQAVAGHPDAISTMAKVADITARIPAAVADDHESMFGWPELRLRHTQSYVYTAQEAALNLYGNDLARERAAMQLHRAHCMIKDGDVSGGTGYLQQILDLLPAVHHTELVYAVARDTLAAVPAPDHKLPAVSGLKERLALPAGRA